MALANLNVAMAFAPVDTTLTHSDADNNDLVWDLARFEQRTLAQQLMLQFEKRVCVYSPTVNQMYTNFHVFFPKEEGEKLIILPNPFAHHDIFHNVPQEAIRPTGLMIVPDYYSENSEPLLRIPLKGHRDPYRTMPLLAGLKLLNARRPVDQPLLPVLAKGDLQELDGGVPALHLHSVSLARLESMSAMEIASIRTAIVEKLQSKK